VGSGVLLAAALGIWQAARAAEALGFGPAAIRDGRERAPAGAGRRAGRKPVSGGEARGAADLRQGSTSTIFIVGAPWREGEAGSERSASWGELSPPAAPVPGSGEAPPDAEAEAVTRIAGEMRRLIRDLEYTPGLQEPIQQTVAPPPATWTPPETDRPQPVIEAIQPRSAGAVGGTRVVIRGRNLRVAQVMFGNAAARIASASANAVTVEAPPGAGQAVIAVTNDDGTWAMAADPFTYLR
jgi:hypothetical protein